jgi:hypothetical protein
VEKGFGYIAELGRVVIPYGIEVAKVFADPDRGFFISLAAYYALSVATVRAEDVANHIEEWAKAVENWDPVGAYESWVRSVTGLGDRPVFYLFNPMVAWEEVSAIEALRESPCGWLDWGCYISNAAKWLLKGILTPVFYIKNLLLGIAYYIIAGAVQVGKFVAVGFLRYVLKPVAYTVAWMIDRVRESLKTVFCYYLKLAQAGTVVKEVAFGRGTLGRRILKGIAKFIGFYILTSIVARECVLVPVEVSPVVSPPTAVGVVPTPTPTPYVGEARVRLDLYEYTRVRVTYLGTGRVGLRATESAGLPLLSGSATARLRATETGTVITGAGTAVVRLDTSETVSIYRLEGTATLRIDVSESVGLAILTGTATVRLEATETATVLTGVGTATVVLDVSETATTLAGTGTATVKLDATETVSVLYTEGSATVKLDASESVSVLYSEGSATVVLDATESATAVGPGQSATVASASILVA